LATPQRAGPIHAHGPVARPQNDDRSPSESGGHLPLRKLTPQHIERLYVAKRGELSPAGVRYIHQVLHAALAHAARMRMIPYNSADGVAPPRPVQQEMLYLTPDEARRFLTLIEDEPLGPLYTLAMTTGMRLGELLGLRWQAISGTDARCAWR
jgi:integrase